MLFLQDYLKTIAQDICPFFHAFFLLSKLEITQTLPPLPIGKKKHLAKSSPQTKILVNSVKRVKFFGSFTQTKVATFNGSFFAEPRRAGFERRPEPNQ